MNFAKKNPVRFLSRSAASSEKLPSDVNLTIVKLNGDEYKIQVRRNATVRQVKKVVESYFADQEVNWPLVWSHFCLAYKNYKLVDDADRTTCILIKDGVKLNFIRHHQPAAYSSLNYFMRERFAQRVQQLLCGA
ncbi:U11/U12 small nuclear ribonucleoprotein 25 kDa protein-like [Papaver somniferum]|uniref:U11/U12 small nuclear ribonucleoprotein 25 kDa protein-like n=1 Tax=Papaver somniferum TaxID=3469 RepID=UPI000E6F7B1B|nr:U11/U12 small nuclear ribonucleoprotein 25 kDa protein-like [Papaver somniferum]